MTRLPDGRAAWWHAGGYRNNALTAARPRLGLACIAALPMPPVAVATAKEKISGAATFFIKKFRRSAVPLVRCLTKVSAVPPKNSTTAEIFRRFTMLRSSLECGCGAHPGFPVAAAMPTLVYLADRAMQPVSHANAAVAARVPAEPTK